MAKSSSSIDSLAKPSKKGRDKFTTTFIVFIVSLLLVWFVLYAFRPAFVQEKDSSSNPTGKIQSGKALGIAFAAAVVLAIITYVILMLMK